MLSWFFLGCSGVPSSTIDPPKTEPASQEAPLPTPRFVVSQDAFGPLRLGMSRQEFVQGLPLDLRLVSGGALPEGLAGQVFTVTNEADQPLFLIGMIDEQVAWLFADHASSEVGTSLGVGFGSSLSFAQKQLGKEVSTDTPKGAWLQFPNELPKVRFSFEGSTLSAILLANESLLPGSTTPLRGIVLPDSHVAFLIGQIRHETEVKTATPLPPVGGLLEGEGTRLASGELQLTRMFAVNPCAKELSQPLQDRIRTDPDFLAYATLLALREDVVEYRAEPLPGSTEPAALVTFITANGEGYARLRLSPEDTIDLSSATFGISKEAYLSAP